MKKAVLYSRVSTEQQASEGVSLDAQAASTAGYAKTHGYVVIGEFCDAGISGKSTKNRPEFLKALDLACREKATLIFYSLSRISRSTRDLMDISEKIKKAGGGLASIKEQIDTSTAMGNFLFTILSALCALERELISERTRGALAHMKATGRKTGGSVPYGWSSIDGNLIADEEELCVIEKMNYFRSLGCSYAAIANHLNALDIVTRNKKRWSAKVVRGILNSGRPRA